MNMASQSHVTLTHVCWGSSQSHMMTSPYSENWSLSGSDSVKHFLSWSHKELRRAWRWSEIIMLRQVSPQNNTNCSTQQAQDVHCLQDIISQTLSVTGLCWEPPISNYFPACCCSQRPATVSPWWLFWGGDRERTTRIFIYVCMKRPRVSFLLNMVKCLWNSFLRDLKMLCSSLTLLHTVNVTFTFLLVVSMMSNWWFCSFTCTKDQMFPPVCLQEERKPESWFQWSRWKDVYWALKQRQVETELFSLRCFSSRYIWFVTEEMIHVLDS